MATTVETDLFGHLSIPVRVSRVWFTARVEGGPSEAARSASTKHARHTLASSFMRFHVGLE